MYENLKMCWLRPDAHIQNIYTQFVAPYENVTIANLQYFKKKVNKLCLNLHIQYYTLLYYIFVIFAKIIIMIWQ